ncbi:hypothetical protein GCM10027275_05760 [Rhabdobacter roseus]|uniref:Uncharacterized membrane-anchored protein YhcB (DUF1043 family) n=1 Tax=Rhabdobacter roseus TaxID=1655419 RepID=A0A840TEA6_9BACT|nr:histidine kinase [Rhabdobacter roseus]MBB5282466.1 uncharacterized membrane-anchored protein YhcB (DUF1043 family) [Rhabdobacter roseus]
MKRPFFTWLRKQLRRNTLYWVTGLFVVPWLVPLGGYFLWGSTYLASWQVGFGASLILLALVALATRVLKALSRWIVRRFPEPQHSPRRVLLHILFFVPLGLAYTQLSMLAFDAGRLYGFRYQATQATWLLVGVTVATIILAGVSESVYAFQQWRVNQLEFQQLEHQHLQSQLDEVKQQVNPHFLFNSLNSLSVLIGDDQAQAERFVDEMANVYRYLLQAGPTRTRSDGLTTLDAELRFVQSYAYLLQTRYGAGFELRLYINDTARPYRLPALTLQTLLDNAIKHNVVSAARPLRVEVRITIAEQLQVRNNLQKRSLRVPLNQAGLATLTARYQLLTGAPLRVEATEQYFTVELPLIRTL